MYRKVRADYAFTPGVDDELLAGTDGYVIAVADAVYPAKRKLTKDTVLPARVVQWVRPQRREYSHGSLNFVVPRVAWLRSARGPDAPHSGKVPGQRRGAAAPQGWNQRRPHEQGATRERASVGGASFGKKEKC